MNNALEIKNIHYKIGNKPILNGLSLEIKKGDCISIVGPSGSGKSTFLKLCADLITLSQGEIKFNGKVIVHIILVNLERKLVIVLRFHIFLVIQ